MRHELRPIEGTASPPPSTRAGASTSTALGMRDKTLTLTVMKRPDLGSKVPLLAPKSAEKPAQSRRPWRCAG